eukprot:scaffold118085_cov47-Prasinocladus_malaysianus.AAC.1
MCPASDRFYLLSRNFDGMACQCRENVNDSQPMRYIIHLVAIPLFSCLSDGHIRALYIAICDPLRAIGDSYDKLHAEAAADLDQHIRLVLAKPGTDFLRENFPDKPEVTLMSSLYIFCRFVYYRWLLFDQLKFDHVTSEDSWQWIIERLLWGIAMAAGSKEIRQESQDDFECRTKLAT